MGVCCRTKKINCRRHLLSLLYWRGLRKISNVHRFALDKRLMMLNSIRLADISRTLTMLRGKYKMKAVEKFSKIWKDTHGFVLNVLSPSQPDPQARHWRYCDRWYLVMVRKALENKLVDVVMNRSECVFGFSIMTNAERGYRFVYKQPKRHAERLGLSFFSCIRAKSIFLDWKLLSLEGY